MSALDRALIQAYRQQRGGAASYRPSTSAPATAAHATHAAETTLAGPHYRINASHVEGDRTGDSSIAVNPLATFRVDVGVAGIPAGPKLRTEPISADAVVHAEPEAAAVTHSAMSAAVLTIVRPRSAPAQVVRQASVMESRPTSELEPDPQPQPKPTLVFKCGIDRPQWIVDRFDWPELCDELEQKLLAGKIRITESMALDKHRAVALAGIDSGVGVSTALLSVARRLAAEGVRPTLVDANLRSPALAELLSVKAEQGWDAVTSGQAALDEVLIESIGDQMVLAPLAKAGDQQRNSAIAAAGPSLWQPLRALSDVLLVDAGPLEAPSPADKLLPLFTAAGLDGVFLVCDCRTTTPQELIGLARELKSAGIAVLGTIENFASDKTA